MSSVPPKAEVVSSNLAGSAIFSKGYRVRSFMSLCLASE